MFQHFIKLRCLCFPVKSSGFSRGTRHPSLLRLREEREPRRQLPAPAELWRRVNVNRLDTATLGRTATERMQALGPMLCACVCVCVNVCVRANRTSTGLPWWLSWSLNWSHDVKLLSAQLIFIFDRYSRSSATRRPLSVWFLLLSLLCVSSEVLFTVKTLPKNS